LCKVGQQLVTPCSGNCRLMSLDLGRSTGINQTLNAFHHVAESNPKDSPAFKKIISLFINGQESCRVKPGQGTGSQGSSTWVRQLSPLIDTSFSRGLLASILLLSMSSTPSWCKYQSIFRRLPLPYWEV